MLAEKDIVFFENALLFRQWLETNHQSASELHVGYYKVGSGKPSMSWAESVAEALCFGWIDGRRTSIDDESYKIRFSPRKANSIWSGVNIALVEKLKAEGLMQPAGLAIYALRKEERSKIYAFEKEEAVLAPEYEAIFRANTKAWAYFEALAPSYKKPSLSWVMSAKQEATQRKRLDILIADAAKGTNAWKDNKYIKKKAGKEPKKPLA